MFLEIISMYYVVQAQGLRPTCTVPSIRRHAAHLTLQYCASQRWIIAVCLFLFHEIQKGVVCSLMRLTHETPLTGISVSSHFSLFGKNSMSIHVHPLIKGQTENSEHSVRQKAECVAVGANLILGLLASHSFMTCTPTPPRRRHPFPNRKPWKGIVPLGQSCVLSHRKSSSPAWATPPRAHRPLASSFPLSFPPPCLSLQALSLAMLLCLFVARAGPDATSDYLRYQGSEKLRYESIQIMISY